MTIVNDQNRAEYVAGGFPRIPAPSAPGTEERVMSNRREYVEGLRMLADALEQHPELPLPVTGYTATSPLRMWIYADDAGSSVRERVAAAMRALKRHVAKVDKTVDREWFDVNAVLAGLHIQITAGRADVCERVVVGTETVTEKVPDPELLATVPEIEITEEREIVRWECQPLLAGGDD